jgi:FKBP-type peptidyl-prolyl cis-trans isomerase
MKNTAYIFFVFALLGQSCSNSDDVTVVCVPETVAQQDPIIDDYIAENNMPMQVTATGLRYSIDQPGTGDNIVYGDVIEVQFQGAFLNGSIFDQGVLGPVALSQGSFIPGFEEGLLLLNEGAQATLILAAPLAYGCFPPQGSTIGDNEILVFEVTILSVNP